jgi:hypothetical protein
MYQNTCHSVMGLEHRMKDAIMLSCGMLRSHKHSPVRPTAGAPLGSTTRACCLTLASTVLWVCVGGVHCTPGFTACARVQVFEADGIVYIHT